MNDKTKSITDRDSCTYKNLAILILNQREDQKVVIGRAEPFWPSNLRKNYLLYQNSPCTDEAADCLSIRFERGSRNIGASQWGDSLHFINRIKKK